jgi:hypothetical protein
MATEKFRCGCKIITASDGTTFMVKPCNGHLRFLSGSVDAAANQIRREADDDAEEAVA